MALVSIKEYEQKAFELLPKNALDYYKSGAGGEISLKLNKRAYDRYRIIPRCLRDVSNRTTATKILGIDVAVPFGIAPTAMQKMANENGEMASARAAGEYNTIYTMSTLATSSIEDVARAAPNAIKWFQLYIYRDRELTKKLIRRAEANGFKAIVLTVDAPFFGLRRADERNKFQLPSHLELRNFVGENGVVNSNEGSGINEYVGRQFDPSISWKDVEWLISFTKLPVVAKGILSTEDAKLALEVGCKGIIVSNHGARQLDTVPAPIEVLSEIVQEVGDRIDIMIDGGITEGTDVYKALALGAKFVFIGRPVLWGLAVNGQAGIEHIFWILRRELDVAMALSGICNLSEFNKSYVRHESSFSKL